MSDSPPTKSIAPSSGDLRDITSREISTKSASWKADPLVGFDQKASLAIAQWVLIIFGTVYVLAFAGMFILFFTSDATFEKGSELVKFMVQSLLPLVTLAVGYYLGDRGRSATVTKR